MFMIYVFTADFQKQGLMNQVVRSRETQQLVSENRYSGTVANSQYEIETI